MTFEEFRDLVNSLEIGNDVEVMRWDDCGDSAVPIGGYFMSDERLVFD